MSIEPVSSAMTYQVQSQAPKPVEKIDAKAADTDVTAAGAEQPDQNTIVIKDADEADSQNGQKDQKDSQQAQKDQQAQQREKAKKAQENIKKMVENLEKSVDSNSEAVFGIHDETKRVTIKIVDKDTKEVLKEYPPEKTLDMIAKVWELAGLFVDEKG